METTSGMAFLAISETLPPVSAVLFAEDAFNCCALLPCESFFDAFSPKTVVPASLDACARTPERYWSDRAFTPTIVPPATVPKSIADKTSPANFLPLFILIPPLYPLIFEASPFKKLRLFSLNECKSVKILCLHAF